jgi:hypothetical protein
MAQLANVEYFYLKCNKELGTGYTSKDWGGDDNIKKAINIDWTVQAVNKVYLDIHKPKAGCTLLLSPKLKGKTHRVAVDKVLVDKVVVHLKVCNKLCDDDCACYKDLNCNCVCASHCTCSGTNHCTGAYQCNCNCACECGSDSECVCDCQPYDCNCIKSLNCDYGSRRPMVQNCGTACNCNCNCDCVNCTCNCLGTNGTCGPTNCANKECDCYCWSINKACNCTPKNCDCACNCGGRLGTVIIGRTCTTTCNSNPSLVCVNRDSGTNCVCHCQCAYPIEKKS